MVSDLDFFVATLRGPFIFLHECARFFGGDVDFMTAPLRNYGVGPIGYVNWISSWIGAFTDNVHNSWSGYCRIHLLNSDD